MSGRIPQSFIDELLARSDIVEIINARLPLKKKGREYTACCPFHNEKTPSFTVSETKQFYHCFGCGAHGSVIGFLMDYEHLDFVDAVETLAAEYHLEVPHEQRLNRVGSIKDQKQPLFELLEQASRLYQQQLRQSNKAIDYLRQRGLSGEIAKRYQLGYAPDSWSFLLDKLGDNPGSIKQLKTTGMVVEKSATKRYDRFRDRIMFPILDRRGHTIAFGGRVIDSGEPKYLNSPETPIFHKGDELYGFFEARRAVRNLKRIVVVEGYMDVVALAQSGFEYAVASLGTATTREQIQRLFRSVSELIFCYDGDVAGHQAAWRALENALPVLRDGLEARFLFLPDGEDPDSLVRKEGSEAFETRLNNAVPLSEYLFDKLKTEIDTASVDGKARLANAAKPLLAKIPASVFSDLMYERLAQLVGISASKLKDDQAGADTQDAPRPKATFIPDKRQIRQNALRDAIALLLQYPAVAEAREIPDFFATSGLPGYALLYELYQTVRKNPGIPPTAVMERWRDQEEFEILEKLLLRNVYGTEEKSGQAKVFSDAVQRLIEKHQRARFEILEHKLERGGLSESELEEYKSLLSR